MKTISKQTPATTNDKVLEKLDYLENILKTKEEKPLSFKEACAYLGYASSYLYKLTSSGKIPHYKPTGKMLFFSKAELDDWIFGRYGDKSNCELRIENGDQKGMKGERQEARSEGKEIRSKKSEREIRRQKSEIESKRGKK